MIRFLYCAQYCAGAGGTETKRHLTYPHDPRAQAGVIVRPYASVRSPRCLRPLENAKTQLPPNQRSSSLLNIFLNPLHFPTPLTYTLLLVVFRREWDFLPSTLRREKEKKTFRDIFLTRPFPQTLAAPSISPSPCLFWLRAQWSSRPQTRWRAHPQKRPPSFGAARPNLPPTQDAPRPHRPWRQAKPQQGPVGDKISRVTQPRRLFPCLLFLLRPFLSSPKHRRIGSSLAK